MVSHPFFNPLPTLNESPLFSPSFSSLTLPEPSPTQASSVHSIHYPRSTLPLSFSFLYSISLPFLPLPSPILSYPTPSSPSPLSLLPYPALALDPKQQPPPSHTPPNPSPRLRGPFSETRPIHQGTSAICFRAKSPRPRWRGWSSGVSCDGSLCAGRRGFWRWRLDWNEDGGEEWLRWW